MLYPSSYLVLAQLHKFIFIFLLVTPSVFAYLKLPNGLDSDERKVVMKKIGFSGTTKYVANGYLLGGYDGIEFSTQVESIPFATISEMSSTAIEQPNRMLTRLGIAKGFFHNLEISFQFIPFFLQAEMSGYSGSLRYTFYEVEDWPVNFDFILHGGGINFANLLGVQSVGMDLVANYYQKYWTFYSGIGQTRIIGTFIGGNNGLTIDNLTATEDVVQNRVFAGLAYDFQSFQLGLQGERFYEGVVNLKIGKRF